MQHIIETTYGGQAANAEKGKVARDGYTIKVKVTTVDLDPTLATVVRHGFASLNYRGGAAMLNHTLGVKTNTEVEYSDADATVVRDELQKWYRRGCPNKKGTDTALPKGIELDEVTVTRYTPGDDSGTSRKMATAFVDQALGGPAADALNTMLGLDDDATYDEQVEAAHAKFFAKKK